MDSLIKRVNDGTFQFPWRRADFQERSQYNLETRGSSWSPLTSIPVPTLPLSTFQSSVHASPQADWSHPLNCVTLLLKSLLWLSICSAGSLFCLALGGAFLIWPSLSITVSHCILEHFYLFSQFVLLTQLRQCREGYGSEDEIGARRPRYDPQIHHLTSLSPVPMGKMEMIIKCTPSGWRED